MADTRWKKVKNILYYSLYVLLAFSIIYAAYRLYKVPGEVIDSRYGIRTRGDYVLIIIQCIFGLLVLSIPRYLRDRLHWVIPYSLESIYLLFLLCSIYLGEVHNFYFRFKYWDSILHTMSGGMLTIIGFYLILILNQVEKLDVGLSPLFIALFAFSFAVTCGVLWEIYEFTCDALFGTNMQKFMTYGGEILVGQAALADTMKDLILDLVSALIVSIYGYFAVLRRLNQEEKKKTIQKEILDSDEEYTQREKELLENTARKWWQHRKWKEEVSTESREK